MISVEQRLRLSLDNVLKDLKATQELVRQAKSGMNTFEKAWHDQNAKNNSLNDVNIALRNENNRLRKLLAMKIKDLENPQTWVEYKITKEDLMATPIGRKITVK